MLTIPLPLPDLNQVIAAAKSHPKAYSRLKKVATHKVWGLAMSAKLTPIKHPVTILFVWYPKNNRMDHDNRMHGQKYILDGLVLAGVFPDDRPRWVVGLHHDFEAPDKKNPRVLVEWTEELNPKLEK